MAGLQKLKKQSGRRNDVGTAKLTPNWIIEKGGTRSFEGRTMLQNIISRVVGFNYGLKYSFKYVLQIGHITNMANGHHMFIL